MKPMPQTLTDPTFVKPDGYSKFDQFWVDKIKDERDLPFVHLSIKITLIMIPLGILLYMPFIEGWVWWTIAALYFYFNNFVYKAGFGLMLHCTSHRPWFKSKYKFMNHYLPWFVGPFFGQTPETYFSHHIGMHHLENNLEADESTTMTYQRDSFGGWFKYYLNFLFTGLITLAQYFHKRNRNKLRNKVIRGEFSFFLLCFLLGYFISWPATIMVFVIPFIISRIIMMLGNWAQHAFVDYDDPNNCYKNSITCINTNYNHKAWNDGYHISHHIKPTLHWTLHPNHLTENLQEYIDNEALVFDNIHFLHVWWYLMTKNYDKLLDNLVNIDGKMWKSREHALSVMLERTKKMERRGITVDSLKKAAKAA